MIARWLGGEPCSAVGVGNTGAAAAIQFAPNMHQVVPREKHNGANICARSFNNFSDSFLHYVTYKHENIFLRCHEHTGS